jgi:hypothetical protein
MPQYGNDLLRVCGVQRLLGKVGSGTEIEGMQVANERPRQDDLLSSSTCRYDGKGTRPLAGPVSSVRALRPVPCTLSQN